MTALWHDFTYRYMHTYDKGFKRASLMIFCTLYFSMIPLTTFYALHTQYIFRTDPLSSGAAFHAAQVLPGELKTLVGDIPAGSASSSFSGALPSQSLMLWQFVYVRDFADSVVGIRRRLCKRLCQPTICYALYYKSYIVLYVPDFHWFEKGKMYITLRKIFIM